MAAVCLDCFENLKNQFVEVIFYQLFPDKIHRASNNHNITLFYQAATDPRVSDCCKFQAAKYGIPVEKRQYNWMQVPPPPEDSVQLITPKERLDKHIVSQC